MWASVHLSEHKWKLNLREARPAKYTRGIRGGGRRCKIHQLRLPPELENSDSHLNLAPIAWLRKASSFQVWRHRYILCKTLTEILFSLSSPQINVAWHIFCFPLEAQAAFKEAVFSLNENNTMSCSVTCCCVSACAWAGPCVMPWALMPGLLSEMKDNESEIVCYRANTLQRRLQDP